MAIFYASNDKIKKSKTHSKRPNNFYMTDSIGANNYIQSLSINSYKKDFGSLCLQNMTNIPDSHKRVADSYVLVRQVFGTPVVHTTLTNEDKKALIRFDFYPLEYTTSKQMEQELAFLKKWSLEKNRDLRDAADEVIAIRAKELKHLIATNYRNVKRDLYDGYRILDRYFQEISKYHRKNL